jgi:ketosteroid isomerase-like protein
MSRENVEMAQRAYEALERGDFDGMMSDLAPSFEYVTTGAIPGVTGAYRGPEGLREFLRWMWDEFDSPRIEVHDLTDAGDRVLASVTLRGRGKQSGVEANWGVWHLWTMQDGKVVHGQAFASREEALEAAGLAE